MQKSKSAANGQSSSIPGAELLDSVASYIRRYLVCDDPQLTMLTLWSACTHCYDSFRTAPYLHLRSPQPHCGKSLCLELLADLSDADIVFSGIPAAALLVHLLQDRSFEEKAVDSLRRCPVLIDDYQRSFGPSERQPLVCLLASGTNASAFFAQGEIGYSLFSPKALAGNSPLPRSLAPRCIPIELRRPKPSERFVRYWSDDSTEPVQTLRKRLETWLEQASSALTEAARNFPANLPPALSPIQTTCAEPLIHIADVAAEPGPPGSATP